MVEDLSKIIIIQNSKFNPMIISLLNRPLYLISDREKETIENLGIPNSNGEKQIESIICLDKSYKLWTCCCHVVCN